MPGWPVVAELFGAWRRSPLPDHGYSIRTEHRGGEHEFITYSATPDAAARKLKQQVRYWAGGLGTPRSYGIVPIPQQNWALHHRRRPCTSPDCPGRDLNVLHESP